MSQKVRVLGVRLHGAPVYVGANPDGTDRFVTDARKVMDWLCDGWRFRFNQHRSHRTTRRLLTDAATGESGWVDLPLGGFNTPEALTDSQAREAHPWLAAMPAYVLQSAERVENTDWFAALKRKKTAGGRLPRFRSRKTSPQVFVCWFNGGANAILTRTGRRTGIVTIKGANPPAHRMSGQPARWRISIRVRLTQEIRPYTNVRVNWSAKTLVFTNEPAAIQRQDTGRQVGLDMGVVSTITTSNGDMLHAPAVSAREEAEYVRLQRKLARQDRTNKARGGKPAMYASRRRAKTLAAMRAIKSRQARRVEDWAHKTTTALVREYDLIAVEDLKVKNMTASGHGKAKRSLNRVILAQVWAKTISMLEYKTNQAGLTLVKVDPAYTSQRCSKCGHTAPGNRESQAVFRCVKCGHAANADTNAAQNILAAAQQSISGQDDGLGRGDNIRPARPHKGQAGSVRETSTPATPLA